MTIDDFKANLRLKYGPVMSKKQHVSLEDSAVIQSQISQVKRAKKVQMIVGVFWTLIAFTHIVVLWYKFDSGTSLRVFEFTIAFFWFVGGLFFIAAAESQKEKLSLLTALSLLDSPEPKDIMNIKADLINQLYGQKVSTREQFIYSSQANSSDERSKMGKVEITYYLVLAASLISGVYMLRDAFLENELYMLFMSFVVLVTMAGFVFRIRSLSAKRKLLDLADEFDQLDQRMAQQA